LRIRTAREGDGETILAFVRELAEYEREPASVLATAAIYDAQLASVRPPFECLIAEEEGEPVGFALYFPTYSTWRGKPGIHLEDLWVTPPSRRRGIGRALLVRVAQIAISRGCARLEWPVLDWNTPAHAFYRALGARPLEEWTTWRLDGDALTAMSGDAPASPRF
jgi:GNAT superfamily N-acetyltransferase